MLQQALPEMVVGVVVDVVVVKLPVVVENCVVEYSGVEVIILDVVSPEGVVKVVVVVVSSVMASVVLSVVICIVVEYVPERHKQVEDVQYI